MKRAAQGGHIRQIAGVGLQGCDGGLAVANHFAGLFQENIKQLGIVIVQGILRCWRWRSNRMACGGGSSNGFYWFGDNDWRDGGHTDSCCGRRSGNSHCHHRSHGSHGSRRGRCSHWGQQSYGGHHKRRGQRDGARRVRRRCHGALGLRNGRVDTAHQWLELSTLLVENKQLFGQHGLVAQHVDQEAQRAQVIANFVKCAGRAGSDIIDLGVHNLLNAVAHAQHGLRSVVQPQNGQNTAHLGQPGRYVAQCSFVLRIAEKLVHRLLKLCQRCL